jgi:hypothetical protein
MTRTVFACLLLVVPAIAGAQSDDELLAEALLPLPDHRKGSATVSMRDDDVGKVMGGNVLRVMQGAEAVAGPQAGSRPGTD